MSNLQVFHDAFAVTFPVEIATQVLDRIEMIHGAEFQKHYGHLSDQELIQLTCTVLNGLTPNELRRGIERMNSEKWCPKLPEFRSWCVQAGEWWTADMAWAKAMLFLNDEDIQISTLTKAALHEVRHILENESQKAAHYAFKDIYQDYLVRAQKAGRKQEMWTRPAAPKQLSENRKIVACPADLVQKLKSVNKNAQEGAA